MADSAPPTLHRDPDLFSEAVRFTAATTGFGDQVVDAEPADLAAHEVADARLRHAEDPRRRPLCPSFLADQ